MRAMNNQAAAVCGHVDTRTRCASRDGPGWWLAYEGAKSYCNLKSEGRAQSRARTMDFQFPSLEAPSHVASLNPRIAVITVVRNTDMQPKLISDPQVVLLDVVPAK
jgi:hypothetical protein